MKIWGIHPVEELCKVRPAALRQVWVLPSFGRKKSQAALLTRLRRMGLVPVEVNGFGEAMVPKGATHQGVVAEVSPFWERDFSSLAVLGEDSLFVLCDHLEDPHNLGAVLRSCAAFGVDGVILPKRRSAVINGTVVKSSSGGVFHLQVYWVPNIVNAIRALRREGVTITGLTPEGKDSLCNFRQSGPLALVLGAEGRGIRPVVKRECDYLLSIPIRAEMGSINVSVATGIALYQLRSFSEQGQKRSP